MIYRVLWSHTVFFLACLGLLASWSDVRAAGGPDAASRRPEGIVLEACGAMAPDGAGAAGAEEGMGNLKLARPGQALSSRDRAFGCRFVLSGGQKGGFALVEARLSRPAAVGGGEAVDRWFVSARRGEAAVAAYVFARPEEVVPGPWTLGLYAGGVLVAEKRFEVAPGQGAPVRQAVSAVPVAAAPSAAPPTPAPASPPAPTPAAPLPDSAAAPAAPPADAPLVAVAEAATAAPAGKTASPPPAASPVAPPPAAQAPAPAAPSASPAAPPAKAPAAPPAGKTRQAEPATVKERPAPAAAGYFALQTGLFAQPQNADDQAARLRRRGFPACVAMEGAGNKRRYRVLAGRFGDIRTARAVRAEVAAAAGSGAIPRQVDPATAARLRCQ